MVMIRRSRKLWKVGKKRRRVGRLCTYVSVWKWQVSDRVGEKWECLSHKRKLDLWTKPNIELE